MKIDLANEKRKIAKRAETDLIQCYSTYNGGDFPALGKICDSMCALREFYKSKYGCLEKSHIVSYFNTVFDKHVVLVLSNGVKRYSYTRNKVVKFLRGEAIHGNSDIKNK